MWIKHIILENFASIKVGMKVNRLEIDFSKRKNKICLLVAPNGTGKTSLLSTLTPFATLGNLDVRDSDNLIISGENGYKEILIVDGPDEYLIKHFYTPNKDRHSVKSYISRNGEELNINGNVRSFQALVESELGLEIGFLKLIRLGNNVTNLLQMTATERKKFLSNLLSDLDIYLNIHKKLTDDARVLKTQHSHLTDKLKRTGVGSKEEIDNALDQLNYEIDELTDQREKALSKLAVIKSKMDEIDYSEERDNVSSLSKKIAKMDKSLEKAGANASLSEYQKKYDTCKANLDKYEQKKHDLDILFDANVDAIDRCQSDIRDAVRELNRDESNEAFESARSIYEELYRQVTDKSKEFKSFKVAYTKEDLEKLISVLIKSQMILDSLYEFGKRPVEKVVGLMLEQRNVPNYINNGLLEYDSSALKPSSLLTKFLKEMGDVPVTCDQTSCGLYKIWVEVKNLSKQEEVKRNADDGEEFYKYMDIIYNKIMGILDDLKTVKDIIQLLPNERKEDFLSQILMKRIAKLKPIYDKEKYNVLLTEITEYENFKSLVEQCKTAETTYTLLKNSSNRIYLEKRRDELEDQELSLRNKGQKMLEDMQDLTEKIRYTKDMLEDMASVISALTTRAETVTKLNEAEQLVSEYLALDAERDQISRSVTSITAALSKTRESQTRMTALSVEFTSTKKDLDRVGSLYNENFYIRRSMSAKEGIPLEYINIYMSNIKTTINELLDLVYDGDLFIDDFKINSDEFRIPYVKDGYPIDDIVSASQGETAFLSIALSFALIAESILKYNIVLLDEVDGNLDDEKRKRFIAVLERLIELIGSEQIFLITHNNLFSMYPVDVISLTGDEDNQMQLSNYIPVKLD